MKVKLEYIWLDGTTPEPSLRSKTKILEYDPLESPTIQSKRTIATNGRIIGASTQGYKRRVDCIDNIESLGQSLIDGIIFSKDKG